jgi:hypothetical protein
MTHSHGVEPNFVPRADLIVGQTLGNVKASFVAGGPR